MDLQDLVSAINGVAKISDLLEEHGTKLRTPAHEEQIHCPFHGADRSPSARHYPDTNSIHCFTCKKSWDPVRFVMEKRGLRFKEALDLLGRRYGVSTDTVTYNSDGTKTLRFKAAGSKDHLRALTNEDKMLMAKGVLEERVFKCKGKTETRKYLNMVYLMSLMHGMDKESDFLPVAAKVSAATKRILSEEVEVQDGQC